MNMELIKTIQGDWYWWFDYTSSCGKNKIFMQSKNYKTEDDAMIAMLDQTINWEIEGNAKFKK